MSHFKVSFIVADKITGAQNARKSVHKTEPNRTDVRLTARSNRLKVIVLALNRHRRLQIGTETRDKSLCKWHVSDSTAKGRGSISAVLSRVTKRHN